jgi:AcrR family transcriptional regulator
MAYEVTKHIKGGTYRYRVDTVHDPQTGASRARWRYLGRLDGERLIAPVRASHARVTRDEIIAITAQLLESRDASHVTVGVIAQHAGISPGTFYRQLGDRRTAVAAALALLAERFVRELPSLGGPIGSREAEHERFFAWFDVLHQSALRGRAFRWFLTQADEETQRAVRDHWPAERDLLAILADYLRRLDAAGLARIADASELVAALFALHAAIVRDVAGHPNTADAAERWSTVFPVFERAVFGDGSERRRRAGKVAPVASQIQARDRIPHHHRDRSTGA